MNRCPGSSDRTSYAIVVCACVVEIVLGTVLARTQLPFCDEGFYGVPAYELSATGRLADPVLESAGVPYLRGIDRAFYWMAPMGMVVQAGAFKLFGFGLLVQRGLSVVCGMGAVLLWYVALRHLVADRVAAFASLLLSLDYVFLIVACRGRSDMISLFFAVAALAAYLHWREQSLGLALAVANFACALSGMVHPNGGIAAIASLAVLTFYLDRMRLRWRHLAIVAACYGLLAVGWGAYIAKAPDLFVAQFFGNVAGRFSGPITLTRLVKGEVTRYISAYGVENVIGLRRLRLLIPASNLGAVLYCAVCKELRRQSKVLLLMFVAISLSLVFLEGGKQGWYLVNLSPLFCALLAICMHRLWNSSNLPARMIVAAQVAIVLLGIASLVYVANDRKLQRFYRPTVAFLNSHVGPRDMVFARSEFYFALKCRNCLRDDENLGAFSGRHAQYIVLDLDYAAHLAKLQGQNPGLYDEIAKRLNTEYREAFHNGIYRIMQRIETQSSPAEADVPLAAACRPSTAVWALLGDYARDAGPCWGAAFALPRASEHGDSNSEERVSEMTQGIHWLSALVRNYGDALQGC